MYLGLNPELDQNGLPLGIAESVPYTDDCQGAGEATDYTDVISSGTTVNDATYINFDCYYTNGGYQDTLPFVMTGYDQNGYAVYDYNAPPEYNRQMFYNYDLSRWEVHSSDSVRWYYESTDNTPSCDPQDWVLTNTACDWIVIACDGSQAGPDEYTLTRTFTYDDGCGNIGECSVTYTWKEEVIIYGASQATADVPTTEDKTLPIDLKEEGTVEIDFSAYPVPFDKEVTIKYNFDFDTNVTIDVFDTKGLLVMSVTENNYTKGMESSKKLNLARGGDQMFYVTVTTSKGSVTKKIVSSTLKRR